MNPVKLLGVRYCQRGISGVLGLTIKILKYICRQNRSNSNTRKPPARALVTAPYARLPFEPLVLTVLLPDRQINGRPHAREDSRPPGKQSAQDKAALHRQTADPDCIDNYRTLHHHHARFPLGTSQSVCSCTTITVVCRVSCDGPSSGMLTASICAAAGIEWLKG